MGGDSKGEGGRGEGLGEAHAGRAWGGVGPLPKRVVCRWVPKLGEVRCRSEKEFTMARSRRVRPSKPGEDDPDRSSAEAALASARCSGGGGGGWGGGGGAGGGIKKGVRGWLGGGWGGWGWGGGSPRGGVGESAGGGGAGGGGGARGNGVRVGVEWGGKISRMGKEKKGARNVWGGVSGAGLFAGGGEGGGGWGVGLRGGGRGGGGDGW